MFRKTRVSVYIKFYNIIKVIKFHIIIQNFHESFYINLKSDVYKYLKLIKLIGIKF